MTSQLRRLDIKTSNLTCWQIRNTFVNSEPDKTNEVLYKSKNNYNLKVYISF